VPRVATVDEIDLFRTDGQAAKLYAAFFTPHVIYTAILASVPSTTDMIAQISFTSGSGTLADIKPDMLLKVGSTAGGQELGIARIRKAPIAGTFYIGEQSIIDWDAAVTVYLTVVDDFDLWGRHVRIVGTAIKMDYDVTFSDQHTDFNPVPVLGPVVSVAELIDGTADLQVGPEDGYHSWAFGASITDTDWESPSPDIAFDDDTAESPIVTVTAPGWHVLYCTVTADNGKTRLGVRYVYAWDKDNPPLSVFKMEDATEDYKTGGINFTLHFAKQASLDEIPDRTLCVVFADDYYGTGDLQEKISIGAVAGRENIVAIGRIVEESIAYDEETQTASLDIQGYQELMKRVNGFPAGLRFKITPEKWTDMPAMTVDRALWHLLEWHTTALTIMDFNRTGDTRKTAQAFSPFASIWEQMQEFAYKQILANTSIDHLGRLWVQIDGQYTPVDDRDYPVVLELEDGDLTGRVELPRQVLSEVGQIDLSGVAVNNGGTGSAFRAMSPGHIPDRTGRVEPIDRLLLKDQPQTNALAGLINGAKNNPYKPLRLKLRANNRLVTCFPNQAITYTIQADKNPRGFAITKNWLIRQRKLSYDGETGVLDVEIVVEAETTPTVSVKAAIPGSGDYTFPPLPGLPPLPPIPPILPGGSGPVSDGGPARVMIYDPTIGLVLCDNFNAGENEQEWYTANGGLTTSEYQAIRRMAKAPDGAIYVMGGDRSFGPDYFLKRAPYAGGIFEFIEDQASINAKLSTTGRDGGIGTFEFNYLLPEFVVYTLTNIPSNTSAEVYRGNYPSFTFGVSIPLSDPRVGDISFGNGKWIYTGNGLAAKFFRLDLGLTTIEDSDFLAHNTQHKHRRISTSDVIYHWEGNLSTISQSTGNCASFLDDIGSDYAMDVFSANRTIFAIDPTGQYIAADRSTTGKGKSIDYGATFLDITDLPFTGHNWRFAQAGGTEAPLSWVAVSGGGYIYYTDDFFNTAPMDKRGNILDLVAVLQCQDVIVVEA
jgi:hypothetical protein